MANQSPANTSSEVPNKLDMSEQSMSDRSRNTEQKGGISLPIIVEELKQWQDQEKAALSRIRRDGGKTFRMFQGDNLLDKILPYASYAAPNEGFNTTRAAAMLDRIVAAAAKQAETMMVFDADKTLAPCDTGTMLWKRLGEETHLDTLFKRPLGHSYKAFRVATADAEAEDEAEADDARYDELCGLVAKDVKLQPELKDLLLLAAKTNYLGAVIITCGDRLIWEKVLELDGLSDKVKVIGGGRIADGFVVTAEVKRALVARLQRRHQACVWAFGDDPLDIPMLRQADRAIVVVPEEGIRSTSMEKVLRYAIDTEGLKASQVLFPNDVKQRLDERLRVINVTDEDFTDDLLARRQVRCFHVTDSPAQKFLTTPTRDNAVDALPLQKAHKRVGHYLATELLSGMLGLEKHEIEHVQPGKKAEGWRFANQKETLVVALMRSGLPLAQGVHQAFPKSPFLHADEKEDLFLQFNKKADYLNGITTVILVDSVINEGKTVAAFAHAIYKADPGIRIFVVANVVQAGAVG